MPRIIPVPVQQGLEAGIVAHRLVSISCQEPYSRSNTESGLFPLAVFAPKGSCSVCRSEDPSIAVLMGDDAFQLLSQVVVVRQERNPFLFRSEVNHAGLPVPHLL